MAMRNYIIIVCCLILGLSAQAQDTVKNYWKNHQLMSVGVEKNGKEDGHWVYYHYNGTKWTEGDYRNGVRVGVWKVWFDDGHISQEYHADNGPFKSWYPSGAMESEGQFVNGKRDGQWTFYHPNGKIFKNVSYQADSIHGHAIEYFDNGKKYFEGDYDMGELEGYACWWNKDGEKNMEGNSVRGLQQGEWKF